MMRELQNVNVRSAMVFVSATCSAGIVKSPLQSLDLAIQREQTAIAGRNKDRGRQI